MRNVRKKVTKQEFNQIFLRFMVFAILEVFGFRWSAITTHIDICMVHSTQSLQDILRKFSKTPNAALYV